MFQWITSEHGQLYMDSCTLYICLVVQFHIICNIYILIYCSDIVELPLFCIETRPYIYNNVALNDDTNHAR